MGCKFGDILLSGKRLSKGEHERLVKKDNK